MNVPKNRKLEDEEKGHAIDNKRQQMIQIQMRSVCSNIHVHIDAQRYP